MENRSGVINAPIARKEGSIIERCINENGQMSITHYDVIKILPDMSVTHFILKTGRTHQIRVHAKYIRSSNHRRYFIWFSFPIYIKTSITCI